MTEFATLSLMAGRGKVLTVRSCTSLRSSFDGRSVKTYFTAFSKLVALFLLFFSLFSLPCLSHSLPRLSHSLPRLSHSLPRLSHSLPRLSHSIPCLSHSVPLRNLRENIIKKYRIPIEKAFTFWAFLSQRVHRFTSFVTFW